MKDVTKKSNEKMIEGFNKFGDQREKALDRTKQATKVGMGKVGLVPKKKVKSSQPEQLDEEGED